MSVRYQRPDLTVRRKLIVGEGPSDFKFFKAFCTANAISGFDHAFTGMAKEDYEPSGFPNFKDYLIALERLAGFPNLTDLVLVFDSAEGAVTQFKQIGTHIREVNRKFGRDVYVTPASLNAISQQGVPRVHALAIPHDKSGGLESICLEVAKNHLDERGDNGTEIEGWANRFASDACQGWSTEKRDKLRLQAFLSAAWQKKPDVHFSQLFDLTRDRFVPLTGVAFNFIRQFLRDVAAL